VKGDGADSVADRASALIEFGRYRDAVKELQVALGKDPDNWWLLCQLSVAFVYLGRRRDALKAANRAAAAQPEAEWPMRLRARIFWDLGRPEDALQAAREATRRDPWVSETWVDLAWYASCTGHVDEAREAAHQALQLDPDESTSWVAEWWSLGSTSEKARGEVATRRAVAADPEDSLGYSNLGYVLLTQRKLRESAEFSRRALALDPHDSVTLHNLATALRCLGEDEEAQRVWLLAAETGLQRADEAVAADPELASGHTERAQALWHMGEVEQALDAVQTALETDPSHAQSWLIRACFDVARGDVEAAVESTERALHLDSESWYGIVQLAELAAMTGDTRRAEHAARRMEAKYPQHYKNREVLGHLELARSAWLEAERHYSAVIEVDFTECCAHAGVAVSRLRLGDRRSAERIREEVSKIYPYCIMLVFLDSLLSGGTRRDDQEQLAAGQKT
jgi:tetratricopeptide (TPR) repeat protein